MKFEETKNKLMSDSMIIKEEVLFKANPEKVWDLLTNPALTKQYMYGCELLSDWNIGDDVLWKGVTENGDEMVYVKGKVLEYEQFKKVTTTTFDPNSGMEDKPENHVKLCYELEAQEDGTKLTITQGDFSGAEDGTKRYESSKGGWAAMVIPAMKKLLG